MKPAVKNSLIVMVLISIIAGAIGYDKYQKGQKGGSVATIQSVPESNVILKIGGSATIGEVLAPNLIKGYMEKNGYADVQIMNTGKDEKCVVGTKAGKKDRIEIASKGTSTGFSSLGSNSIDLCMASSQAPAGSTYDEHVIGLDGIAVIVNKNSNLQSISMPEIASTFSGGNMKIYRMDDNSGTYKVFKETAMSGKEITTSAQKYESATDLVSAVGSDASGIGFVSYTFATGVNIKPLPISINANMPPIVPNALTIQSEKYPLCRRLYFYANKSANPLSMDILKFIESSDGQKIVNDNGFVNLSINVNNNSINPIAMPNDPPAYTNLINTAKKITTEFRFQTGSQHLDSRGLADVLRLVQFMSLSENRNKKVILVGFTDNVGDDKKNIPLSVQRANVVSTVLEASGVSIKSVLGFGSARPVRGNETEEDRANNRRVEVWLID